MVEGEEGSTVGPTLSSRSMSETDPLASLSLALGSLLQADQFVSMSEAVVY